MGSKGALRIHKPLTLSNTERKEEWEWRGCARRGSTKVKKKRKIVVKNTVDLRSRHSETQTSLEVTQPVSPFRTHFESLGHKEKLELSWRCKELKVEGFTYKFCFCFHKTEVKCFRWKDLSGCT